MNNHIAQLTSIVHFWVQYKNVLATINTNTDAEFKDKFSQNKSLMICQIDSVLTSIIIQFVLHNCNIIKIGNLQYVVETMNELFTTVQRELITNTFMEKQEQMQITQSFAEFFKIICK